MSQKTGLTVNSELKFNVSEWMGTDPIVRKEHHRKLIEMFSYRTASLIIKSRTEDNYMPDFVTIKRICDYFNKNVSDFVNTTAPAV